jgi:DNA-binding transcriptional LysR family regulator
MGFQSRLEKMTRFYYKKSRLQQLKGFCLTAQLNSMAKAAKKMNLGISTISMQVKSLEDDLKIQLFDRDKKNGLILTKKGQELYDMSVKYVYGIDNIFEKFLFMGDIRYQNKLNIATTEIILSNLLPHTIAKFKKKYPNTDIILHNITKEECKHAILDKKIDIGIYPFSPDEKISVDFKITKYKEFLCILLYIKIIL